MRRLRTRCPIVAPVTTGGASSSGATSSAGAGGAGASIVGFTRTVFFLAAFLGVFGPDTFALGAALLLRAGFDGFFLAFLLMVAHLFCQRDRVIYASRRRCMPKASAT